MKTKQEKFNFELSKELKDKLESQCEKIGVTKAGLLKVILSEKLNQMESIKNEAR